MEEGLEKESIEKAKARLDEYEKSRTQIKNKADVLKRHGINSEALIKLLSREINVLKQRLGIEDV